MLGSSKTDYLRAGTSIFVASNNQNLNMCPVNISKSYFRKLKSGGYKSINTPVLVDTIQSKSKGEKVTPAARSTKLLRDNLKTLVTNVRDYSLHSFRSGGATAAAESNVPRELIAKHGRWQSSCVNRYIKEDCKLRLGVTQAIQKSLTATDITRSHSRQAERFNC